MKLLAIETATEACSAALYLDGEVREIYRLAPREHAALILGMADELLVAAGLGVAQLDAIAFGCGPGAFTGVRIATGVAQGIAFAADLPVVPVSTLATLAQGGRRLWGWPRVAAAIDARMGEVYWGAFEADDEGLMLPCGEERVLPPQQVPTLSGSEWHGIGSGWQSYGEELASFQAGAVTDYKGEALPHAQDVALLAAAAWRRGETVDAQHALPHYLRDQVTHQPARR